MRAGVETGGVQTGRASPTALSTAIGAELDALAPAVRALHADHGRFEGRITVRHGAGLLAPLIAKLTGLPRATDGMPLRLTTASTPDGADRWVRDIGARSYPSQIAAAGDGLLSERMGPVTATTRIAIAGGGIAMTLVRARFLGMPLPGPLAPGVETLETEGERDGRRVYRFDVRIRLPVLGTLLVHYQGWLDTLGEGGP